MGFSGGQGEISEMRERANGGGVPGLEGIDSGVGGKRVFPQSNPPSLPLPLCVPFPPIVCSSSCNPVLSHRCLDSSLPYPVHERFLFQFYCFLLERIRARKSFQTFALKTVLENVGVTKNQNFLEKDTFCQISYCISITKQPRIFILYSSKRL